VIGAGAVYTAYKAKKALKKFGKRKTKGKKSYKFEEWDSWRQEDGILCRDTDDCWLDERLTCTYYPVARTKINPRWFGGDITSIRGTCQCDDKSRWDEDDLNCAKPSKDNWVKKVVIGAGVQYSYGGYEGEQAVEEKFWKSRTKEGKKFGFHFAEWDQVWRYSDGILCRDTHDCWLDERLTCTDHAVVKTEINPGWFGGDIKSIRGTCQCDDDSWWNEDETNCENCDEIQGPHCELFSEAKQILPIPLLALASIYLCVF